MEVGDEKAIVVDFGESKLGSNKSIFDGKTMPILKNIVRTGPNTWNAEVVKGFYDEDDILVAIDYEPTTITSTTNSEGKETITLSNVTDFSLKSWIQKESGYTPPIQSITCDTTPKETVEGNTVQFPNYLRGIKDFQDVPTESCYYLPLMRDINTPCHYKIKGKIHIVNGGGEFDHELFILLPEKPTTNHVYNITSSSYVGISILAEGEASVNIDGYYPKNDTDKLYVTVSGGKVTATVTSLLLISSSHFERVVSCTLTGN